MGVVSNIYLIIFLPLVASLVCQALPQKRIIFWFGFTSSVFLFFLLLKIFPDILIYDKIENDFELAPLSLALEFKLDLSGIIFLLLLVFLKIVILVFYRSDIERSLNIKNDRIFYSVFLLHLFALVGIFTSNNFLNLLLFFEIYAFSFFAITSISNDVKLLKISFRYFCFNCVSSLLFLFFFFSVYLIFGEVNFNQISENFSFIAANNSWLTAIIFLFLAAAVLIRFFPLWLYFDKIKSANPIANFLVIDSLFIKTLIGIFLILKFVYFFFHGHLFFVGFDFKPLLIFLAILLIFYSSIRLYHQKHLKLICLYFCLNNLGFIIAAIALRTLESLQAMFFYLLNFALVNLFIFIFATFLKRYFSTSSIGKLWLVAKDNFLLTLPLKLSLFFVASFPMTIMFFANWYMAYASFKLGFEAFLLAALVISNFSYAAVAIKIVNSFFAKQEYCKQPAKDDRQLLYLLSFWFVISAIYSTVFLSGATNNLAIRFASYLL